MTEGVYVGAFLEGTKLRVGRVRRNRIEMRQFTTISASDSHRQIQAEIIRLIDRTVDKDVAGIGFGVPSIVDVERGIVFETANIPNWKEVHLKDELEDRYGVPCLVNNEANVTVLGEKHFGKGRDCNNIVAMILATGFGAGVIIDGHLCVGHTCGVGELGHLPYLDDEFEAYCSRKFLDRKLPQANSMIVSGRARRGDPEVLGVLEELGHHVGNAILTALYCYDPELVVLTGRVAGLLPYFEKKMWQKVKSYRFNTSLSKLRIERSELADVGLLGAAALHFDT